MSKGANGGKVSLEWVEGGLDWYSSIGRETAKRNSELMTTMYSASDGYIYMVNRDD